MVTKNPIHSIGKRGKKKHETLIPVIHQGGEPEQHDVRIRLLYNSTDLNRYAVNRANDLRRRIKGNNLWHSTLCNIRLSLVSDLLFEPAIYTGRMDKLPFNDSNNEYPIGVVFTNEVPASQFYSVIDYMNLLALDAGQITPRVAYIPFDDIRIHPYNDTGKDVYQSLFNQTDIVIIRAFEQWHDDDVDTLRMVVYRCLNENRLFVLQVETSWDVFIENVDRVDSVFGWKLKNLMHHVPLGAINE